jgi:hypothetical protein
MSYLHTSEPIPAYYGGEVKVTARPVRGGQLAPEVSIRERGVEVLSMSPDAARALAAALTEAADHAEH